MYSLAGVDYSPILRGKAGEFLALQKLRDPIKDCIAPMIVLPSLSIKDLEKHRRLTKSEAARIFVERIVACWSGRPFFLDPSFLKFDVDDKKDAFLLKSLLTLCERFNCKAIPTVSLRTSSSRIQTYREHVEKNKSGIAFKVSLRDFDKNGLEEAIIEIQRSTGAGFHEMGAVY